MQCETSLLHGGPGLIIGDPQILGTLEAYAHTLKLADMLTAGNTCPAWQLSVDRSHQDRNINLHNSYLQATLLGSCVDLVFQSSDGARND